MIEWISSWLKQIVLLVLIATFIDLLLPNNAMDRYVKLVMGLLIIMAILSPTLQLLHSELDLSSIALSDKYEEGKQMDPIDQIKEKGNDLKKSQETFVQKEVERSIGEMVEKDLTHQFPVEVIQTNVQLQNNVEQNNQVNKIEVIARLRFASSREESKLSTQQGMKPIQPVMISGGSIQRENARTASNSKKQELTKRITQYLQRTWNLLPEQINVRVDPA